MDEISDTMRCFISPFPCFDRFSNLISWNICNNSSKGGVRNCSIEAMVGSGLFGSVNYVQHTQAQETEMCSIKQL